MEQIPDIVLVSAFKSLLILSKVRAVDNYISLVNQCNAKNLRAWPNEYEKDELVLQWLDRLGIRLSSKRVKSLSVQHRQYKYLDKIDLPSITKVRASRDMVTALIISRFNKPDVEIISYFDTRNGLKIKPPVATSDFIAIEDFSKRRDAMYGFYDRLGKRKYKIPAYVGEFLFREGGFFSNMRIEPKDRKESVGYQADETGRAQRFVVHKGNHGFLADTLKETVDACSKISQSTSWAGDLQKIANTHLSRK